MLGQNADENNFFTCSICFEHVLPFKDPVLLSDRDCRHCFCREHIEAVEDENGQYPCPACRRVSDSLEPLSSDGLANRMFQSAVVACPKECGWSGPISGHEKHYQNCVKFKCDCGAFVMLPTEIEVRLARSRRELRGRCG